MIFSARTFCSVLCQTRTVYFFYFLEQCNIDAFRIINPACGIRAGNRFCTKLLCLLDRIDRYITGTGYCNRLACDVFSIAL